MLDKHGNISTYDYEAMKQWILTQPAPTEKCIHLYVNALRKTKNINHGPTSYGLKHKVEKFSEFIGPHEYVSNTDLIIAMVQAGFSVINTHHKPGQCAPGPNYYFNAAGMSAMEFAVLVDSVAPQGMVAATKAQEAEERRKARKWLKVKKEVFKNCPDMIRGYQIPIFSVDGSYIELDKELAISAVKAISSVQLHWKWLDNSPEYRDAQKKTQDYFCISGFGYDFLALSNNIGWIIQPKNKSLRAFFAPNEGTLEEALQSLTYISLKVE